jgi:hypothetical protein
MNGDNMERKDIVVMDSRNNDSAEWVSIEDGKWLIYKDFLYNVLTDEKIEIKGLPDFPENNYRAASPDLQTIIYQGNCFSQFQPTSEIMHQKSEKFCAETKNLSEQTLIPFWLTDTKTGEATFLTLSRQKFDWLIWNQEKFEKRNDWLKLFQSKLIWEKDKNGKFQLSLPK